MCRSGDEGYVFEHIIHFQTLMKCPPTFSSGGVGRRGHDDDEGRGCREEEAADDEVSSLFYVLLFVCFLSKKRG